MVMEEIVEIIRNVLNNQSLIKAVFSKYKESTIKKSVGRVVMIKEERCFQIETFYADGKAKQFNYPESCNEETLSSIVAGYRQINLFTTGGNCEILLSKSGHCHINNRIKSGVAVATVAQQNNREKKYIIDPSFATDFLCKLGVSDSKGNIFDKKRPKFRQINRFVEILDDCYDQLPKDGPLCVCDLCCGKSYLTFAVYFYLTVLKKRTVKMYGVDLKKDVIDFCQNTAQSLGYEGMEFLCGDIFNFKPETPPHLVISLHACDIATDIVLANAIRLDAKVILSTPCCHHEMMNQLDSKPLSFVSKYSMYRQKMCDALTDALRCTRLEAAGYKVSAIELIDPEETPKNILIRAIKANIPQKRRDEAMREYRAAVEFLNVHPYLDNILREDPI